MSAMAMPSPTYLSMSFDPLRTLQERRNGVRCGALEDQRSAISLRLFAGSNVALGALAGFFLGNPAGVDDDVQIVLGDRQRREKDGLHGDALRPAVEGLHAF